MQPRDRILIVDDHPTNVALLKDILADDYLVATAASGEEALAIVSDFRPDLVLLDIMMPGLNGYETCQRMRVHPALRQTKIIMVSAKAMTSERLQGYEAGADDYITKPFDEDELLAKVRVYLRLKSVEEIDRLKSDLILLLSHETRTPLNSIIPPLQILMSEEDLSDEERKAFLTMAYKSSEHLHNLFERVLQLSAMKAGQWKFQFIPTDLRDVVRLAVGAMSTNAAGRQVKIEPILPADAAVTLLDETQMHQVVTAILDNAVGVSAVDGCVEVKLWREHDQFCLTVTDTGDGIDADFLPHMFEEFAQPSLAHHSHGVGLSLALARQIVQAHNGSIEVESSKGAGAAFTVRLPVRVAQTA